MDIAILGTGLVGRTLAGRFAELGHTVTVGTRDPQATLARTGEGEFGDWAAQHRAVGIATFADAVGAAELVVNATNGGASLDVLALTGPHGLAGKVLMDVANPLDVTHGLPPTLFVKDTDSLGERIQRAYPAARVVKALNTVNAMVMAHPEVLPEPGTVFICGNNQDAKATVTTLLAELGHRDIIDLGDITGARGTEMMIPVWVRLWGALGGPAFNFKVVR